MFVDNKIKDIRGEMAIAKTFECVEYNLKLIGNDYYNELQLQVEQNASVFAISLCGRYITTIELTGKQEGVMLFIDVENNYDKALDFYNSILTKKAEAVRHKFIKSFEELSKVYVREYHSVELKLLSEVQIELATKFS